MTGRSPMEQANAAVRIAARRVEPDVRPDDAAPVEPAWAVALVALVVVLVGVGLLILAAA